MSSKIVVTSKEFINLFVDNLRDSLHKINDMGVVFEIVNTINQEHGVVIGTRQTIERKVTTIKDGIAHTQTEKTEITVGRIDEN